MEQETKPLINTDDSYGDMDRRLVPEFERQNGTKLLQENSYDQAIKSFSKAIMAFEFLIKDNQIGREQISGILKETVIPCYSNITLCYLKKQQFQQVATFASRVIENDRDNVKAYYRRGVAYSKIKKFSESRSDLEKARLLDPSLNDAVNSILRNVTASQKAERDKEKQMAKRLLQGFGEAIKQENLTKKNAANTNIWGRIRTSVSNCCRSIRQRLSPKDDTKST